MEWCVPQFGDKCSELYEEDGLGLSDIHYDFVILILVIIIGLAILGNYLWSKKKEEDILRNNFKSTKGFEKFSHFSFFLADMEL